jgi:hypothetical protein
MCLLTRGFTTAERRSTMDGGVGFMGITTAERRATLRAMGV